MAARSSLTVVSGTTITSSWGNSVRNHSVPFTTSDDVSSEGQLAVNTSTNMLVVHNGSAAQELVRYGAPSSFSIAVGQAFSVSFTTSQVGYVRCGPWVLAHAALAFTSSGSTGSPITIATDLPAPAAATHAGTFLYTNSTTATYYQGTIAMDTGADCTLVAHLETGVIGQDPSFAIVSGHAVALNFAYWAG